MKQFQQLFLHRLPNALRTRNRVKMMFSKNFLLQARGTGREVTVYCVSNIIQEATPLVQMKRHFNTALHATVGRILDSGELHASTNMDSSQLEEEAFDYILDCTPDSFSLWTSDQVFVNVGEQFWKTSPVLMAHSAKGRFYHMEASSETVKNLKTLSQDKIFPPDLSSVLELIAVVKYLEIDVLLELCYIHFCSGNGCSASLPSDCSRNAVLRMWELLCASPMRTKSIYQEYFKLLQDYNRDTAFLNLAKNIVKVKFREYTVANLEGLPVDFSSLTMVTGIFTIEGVPKTAVVDVNSINPVNIFNSSLREDDQKTIRDFFLVYNNYIIYRDRAANVCYKHLKLNNPPVKIASNIMQLLHKGSQLFFLANNWIRQKHQIFKWTGNGFIELIPRESVGIRLDFDAGNNILCYENALRNVLYLDFVRDSVLIPHRRIEHGCIHLFVFYKKELYVWGKHVHQVYDTDGNLSRTKRMPAISENVSECKVIDGKLFVRLSDIWHVYRAGQFEVFCHGTQLEALEEVCLNPYFTATLS